MTIKRHTKKEIGKEMDERAGNNNRLFKNISRNRLQRDLTLI